MLHNQLRSRSAVSVTECYRSGLPPRTVKPKFHAGVGLSVGLAGFEPATSFLIIVAVSFIQILKSFLFI